MNIPLLVSPQWLQDNLTNLQIQVIENAWFADSCQKGHIAGAVCSPSNPYLKRSDEKGEKNQYVMEAEEFFVVCYRQFVSETLTKQQNTA